MGMQDRGDALMKKTSNFILGVGIFATLFGTVHCSDHSFKSLSDDASDTSLNGSETDSSDKDAGSVEDTNSDFDAGTDTKTVIDSDAGTNTDMDTNTGTATDTDTDFDTGTDTDTGTATATDSAPQGDTASEMESDTATDSDSVEEKVTYELGPPNFEQTNDENGLVVIEAEDYTLRKTATDGSYWKQATGPDGYFGLGAMQAGPPDYGENRVLSYAQENAPVLVYTVNFVKAEPVYVWARASHSTDLDDSVWFGKNGQIETMAPLTFLVSEQEIVEEWYYIHFRMDGDESRAVLNIPEAGVQTFELYMREPDFLIDRIILTTNPNFNPAEDLESPDAGTPDAGEPDGGD
jgi:hypothetical protein